MRPPKAVFHMVDLTATDVLATVAFYRRLGVDIPDDKVWVSEGKAHHVEARLTPDTGLGINSSELTSRYDTSGAQSQRGSSLIFSVDTRADVDVLYDDLTGAGYAGHLTPFDAFWGSRYAVVDDPDGNHVGIMSPQDQAHDEAPDAL